MGIPAYAALEVAYNCLDGLADLRGRGPRRGGVVVTAPRRTISTQEAAQLLGVSPKTVRSMLRDEYCPLAGYPVHTMHGHVHAWRVYTDSVAEYQRRQERAVAAAGGWPL